MRPKPTRFISRSGMNTAMISAQVQYGMKQICKSRPLKRAVEGCPEICKIIWKVTNSDEGSQGAHLIAERVDLEFSVLGKYLPCRNLGKSVDACKLFFSILDRVRPDNTLPTPFFSSAFRVHDATPFCIL